VIVDLIRQRRGFGEEEAPTLQRTFVLSLLLAAACSRGETPAGFTTTELVHRVNGKQERETAAFGPDGVRYTTPDGTTILRYADRTVFLVDDVNRTVREMSLDAFSATMREKQLQPDVPDVAAAMGGQMKVEVSPEPTTFADLPCRLVRIESGTIHVELWTTDALAPPGPRRPTFEFLHALGGPLALPADVFERLPGFPVRSIVRVATGLWEIKVARALLAVDRKPPDAASFETPADYRKTG
jgi:hypothetical protein